MKPRGDVTSWVVLLTASTSLVSMICLYLVDDIVRGTLYNHGLQFSYDWATPYWRLMQICFALGWINIATAFVVQANAIRLKRKAEQPADAIREAWKTAKSPETEAPEENSKEKTETEPTKPPEEAPHSTPEPEAQEKKEEPQPPEKTPEQEPQLQETKPDEIPSLASLF